jgi:hypothetical protein
MSFFSQLLDVGSGQRQKLVEKETLVAANVRKSKKNGRWSQPTSKKCRKKTLIGINVHKFAKNGR